MWETVLGGKTEPKLWALTGQLVRQAQSQLIQDLGHNCVTRGQKTETECQAQEGQYPLPPLLVSVPLLFIFFVAHGIVNGIIHHLLFHVHYLCLPLKLHHDFLDLGQLELWEEGCVGVCARAWAREPGA